MQGTEKVVVVLACDSNMLLHTYVTIASVLEHRHKKYELKFYILFPEHENEEFGNVYKGELEKRYQKFDINFIRVNNSYFTGVKQLITHITTPTNYRLLLPRLLGSWDRCIYLDCDICVCGDIIQLWNEDIEEYYIAGVKAGLFTFQESERLRYVQEFQYENFDEYINAGVLLINLRLLRQDNVVEEFLHLINHAKFPMGDQDVINHACRGKIKLLSYKYNVCPMFWALRDRLQIYKGLEKINEGFSNPIVVHFAGAHVKPWENLASMFVEQWWNVAENVLGEEKSIWYAKAWECTRDLFYLSLEDRCRNQKSIILGFGNYAKVLIDHLVTRGINNIICCCDSNQQKWGDNYRTIECRGFEEVTRESAAVFYINSVQVKQYQDEIMETMNKMGIASEAIVQYSLIPDRVKRALNPKYNVNGVEETIDFEKLASDFASI